jgi:signal transduction histidine kinase
VDELVIEWRWWAAPYFAAAGVCAAMLVLVLVRGRGPVRAPFLGFLLAIGGTLATTGTVFIAGDRPTALTFVRISQSVAVWTSPLAIEFVRALTGRKLAILRPLGWVGASIAFLLSFTPWVIAASRPYGWGFAGTAGPLYVLILAEMSLTLSVPTVLLLHLGKERRPLERVQLITVFLASAMGGLAFVDTLPLLGYTSPPLGWLPLVCAAGTLMIAIVRHRLLDVRLAVRRTLLWIALTFLGGTPFALAAMLIAPRLAEGSPLRLALLYALLVVGMRAYLVTLQPRIDRLVGRRSRDLDAELANLANQAATLQTSEELGRAIDRFLAALDRRLAALVVIDAKGRPRVALSAWGSVPAPSRQSPLLTELAHSKTLLSRDHAAGPAQIEIERACVRWGAELLGPLVEGDELLGLIAISPRQGGGVGDAVELEALDRMRVTITAALAGARLYERLHALSNELEQKAETRSQSLAKTLRDLRGAEQRLVQSEKLASLGQIVAGVAADLSDEVRTTFDHVARLRRHAEVLFAAAAEARAALPERAAGDPLFDEMRRDLGPLLDAVSEGARRADAIAQDLSRFADVDEEAPKARTTAHLAALIDSTLTLVTGHLADVAVVRDYDETLPAIPVESGPLGQVILNLILNATQAMKGSGTLTLSTRRTETHAELAVADTGPGITPEVLPRIFEPFFSTKVATTGTGLGLSISYGIVKRHGGRISVESTLGIGSTFRVHLPLP